jgi:hypothetical protein
MGVQFHPEADGELVDVWAQSHPELPETGLTPADLAAQSETHAEGARGQAFRLFDNWIASALATG